MNERIKELAEKSGAGWDDKYHWYVGNEQMKKFAEILLKDVAQFVEDKFDFCGDEITIAEKIREHYGVEK